MRSRVGFRMFVMTVALAAAQAHPQSNDDDLRRYGHGLDLLPREDGKLWMIWSSSGNPPSGDWTHDIFYSLVDPAKPVITPVKLISNPEAQEPASSAQSTDGHIFITMEDGWNTCCEVAQRYGVYDKDLKPILAYPQMVQDGGHSGHVAASGNRFVVFYSDEWVDGGGVDDLGTGDDVIATIYGTDGKLQRRKDIAVGQTYRDWWPLVAASENRACLIWQRYVAGQVQSDLYFSMLDPATGSLIKDAVKLTDGVKYYHYSVKYLPSIDRFLVRGTYEKGGGFGFLMDGEGKITAENRSLPSVVRESQSIPRSIPGGVLVAQPQLPSGVSMVMATTTSLTVQSAVTDTYEWQYCGTDGVFTSDKTLFIASLSDKGLVIKEPKVVSPTSLRDNRQARPGLGAISNSGWGPRVDGKGRRMQEKAAPSAVPAFPIPK